MVSHVSGIAALVGCRRRWWEGCKRGGCINGGGSIRSVPTVLWLVEDAAGDDRRGRRLEGLGGRTKLLPYLENQSTISLRERQSGRPNHAGELRHQVMRLAVDRQGDRQMVSGPGRGATPGPLTLRHAVCTPKNGSAASSVTTHLHIPAATSHSVAGSSRSTRQSWERGHRLHREAATMPRYTTCPGFWGSRKVS